MAKRKEKEKALQLRNLGKSFSQIRAEVDVSKSTLSRWLQDMPLSKEQLVNLRDKNPVRIEKYRETMRRKKDKRLDQVYVRSVKDIGTLSKRDFFIAGLFLYWAEGTKTDDYTTSLANTDPAILKFFVKWLELLGVDRKKLRIRLHVYSDMSEEKMIHFWSKTLDIPTSQFRKSYIKENKYHKETPHKGRFGYGTCNVIFGNRDIKEYISMCLKYLQETHT